MKIKYCKMIVFLLVFIYGAMFCHGGDVAVQANEPKDDYIKKVDALFQEWNKAESPGCVIAIIKDGKILYKHAYGMADLEHDIPLTTKTVFDVGSMTKQFTAFSIALLEQQGKLSLDDDVRKYIPELPDYGKPVTLRQMIYHSSGLRDYDALMRMAGYNMQNDTTDEEILDIIARQKKLNFMPGAEHLYSNTGYFLLSIVVKRVSGKSLREYADENIFKPLGMKNTLYRDDHTVLIKNRAVAYEPVKDGGYRIDISLLDNVGDGGVYTTVEDLYLWDQNFYESKLAGGNELVARAVERGTLANGDEIDYAYGLGIMDYKGLPTQVHGGAWMGYRSFMVRYPEQQFTVAILANVDSINTFGLVYQVADIFLADQFKEEKQKYEQKIKAVKVPEKLLQDKTGTYRNTITGNFWTLEAKKGELLVTTTTGVSFAFVPVSKTEFQSVNAHYRMKASFEKKDTKTIMHVSLEDEVYYDFEPVVLVNPAPEELKHYTGKYFSEELQVKYTVLLRDNMLYLSVKYDPEQLPLQPTLQDEFTVSGLIFKFHRDTSNQITDFSLDTGKVKDIEFKRL